MIEDHFPDFYKRADAYSAQWQARYLRSQKVQLLSLLAGAAVAAAGSYPFVVVALFSLAVVAQLYRLTSRADEKWWNGRAGAESAKTASWLYVTRGAPFGADNASAEIELAARISEIAKEVAKLVPVASGAGHVTPEMRTLRSQPLSERVNVYQRQRIQDQCDWYSNKAQFNETRAAWWSFLGVAAPGAALILGIAAAVYDWELDAVGLFAAIGAAVVAWMAVKQYETLARSYAVASAELSAIDVQISSRTWTEEDWAPFVNAAEDAISREHTSWRASRAV